MMEIANTMLSSELQVFLNYVYEYKKGVRNMVLCTLNRFRARCPPPAAIWRQPWRDSTIKASATSSSRPTRTTSICISASRNALRR